jgi:hypothetical protein
MGAARHPVDGNDGGAAVCDERRDPAACEVRGSVSRSSSSVRLRAAERLRRSRKQNAIKRPEGVAVELQLRKGARFVDSTGGHFQHNAALAAATRIRRQGARAAGQCRTCTPARARCSGGRR